MKFVLFNIYKNGKKKFKVIKKEEKLAEYIYVYISDYILKLLNNKFLRKVCIWYFTKYILNNEKFIYATSKKLKDEGIDNYLIDVKNAYKIKIEYGNILKNSIRYLEDLNKDSTVALVCNYLPKDVLGMYLSNFKKVDIYTKDNLLITESMINSLQQEYGVLIDINKYSENTIYDALIYLDDTKVKFKIKSKKVYILTSDVLDKFSEEYKIYNEYKQQIIQNEDYISKELAYNLTYLHKLCEKS